MKPIEKFRKNLTDGKIVVGTSISFTDPLVTDALGDSVEFVWIDLEHCNMSTEALGGHLLAARSRMIPSLVRVSGSSTPFIKTVLDAGADGIIVPQIKSVDEVISVVSDCRYPPKGKRGYGPRVPSNFGRFGGDDYVKWCNDNIFVSVQIETKEALEALDDILAVPGLDSIVIGPYDLSASLGYMGQVEHPEVVKAIEVIISKARVAGLFVGAGMGADPEYAYIMGKRGVQWLQVGSDYTYLVDTAEQVISSVKQELGVNIEVRKTSY